MLRVFLISEGGNEWVYASQCAEKDNLLSLDSLSHTKHASWTCI